MCVRRLSKLRLWLWEQGALAPMSPSRLVRRLIEGPSCMARHPEHRDAVNFGQVVKPTKRLSSRVVDGAWHRGAAADREEL